LALSNAFATQKWWVQSTTPIKRLVERSVAKVNWHVWIIGGQKATPEWNCKLWQSTSWSHKERKDLCLYFGLWWTFIWRSGPNGCWDSKGIEEIKVLRMCARSFEPPPPSVHPLLVKWDSYKIQGCWNERQHSVVLDLLPCSLHHE